MIEDYEDFSEQQKKILDRYVTSTSSNIFCLRNLPEVIKGALFSRYSRSSLGLRSLLLKEFIMNEETAFDAIAGPASFKEGEPVEDQVVAIKKAQNFYDRILDGYGDDSIGELGGAHLALENVSMLAAKIVEDARLGGSPLEKSTRYIYFDQKAGGEYLYYREPIVMTSAYKELYLQTCDKLFDTYSALVPKLTEIMENKFPKEHGASDVAYNAAIRAKVLDCLRGLLPTSALTNMGVFGNGRFFETLTQKLHGHSLSEMQDVGKKGYVELSKVIPSFVRRAKQGHKYQTSCAQYTDQLEARLQTLARSVETDLPVMRKPGVRLISHDPEGPVNVAAALLFSKSKVGLLELTQYCQSLDEEELGQILEAGASFRENRRHKSPRALEHASFTFEIVADFGVYRDLQRHRTLTQQRQLLTCDLSYYVPSEIRETEMEGPYCEAMDAAKEAFDKIRVDFPEEAQYIVPMGYNIHWYFHINLRALQWLCELRSIAAGHPSYRFIAQEMAKQASEAYPQFERYFKFVDYEGYELGRMGQETRIENKRKSKTR